MALADKQLAQRYRESGLSSFCNPAPTTPLPPKIESDLIPDQTNSKTQDSRSTGSFCKTAVGQVSDLPSSAKADGSFCKTTPSAPAAPKLTPRNAQCPCNSGQKYKRCCGKDAPPVLNKAA
jgi:hypothetical protein